VWPAETRSAGHTRAMLNRPPWKYTRRSFSAGRNLLPQNRRQARDRRIQLADEALRLRLVEALSIQTIADRIGTSKGVVARWLKGIYPLEILDRPWRRHGANLPRQAQQSPRSVPTTTR
jgi:hypothetical protein